MPSLELSIVMPGHLVVSASLFVDLAAAAFLYDKARRGNRGIWVEF